VSWPTAQEYNEAIQNPAFNFADPELKRGAAETTALGLPRPICGGFASVYRMQCGARDWAVRCFLREFADQQDRYSAIGKHLASAGLSQTVAFEFQEKGIRVGNRWFPILKMEWLKGRLLHQYIEANLKSPGAILALAKQWSEMIDALTRAQVAHGDLQHGNVLVVDGKLRLIDYDGMYVPALVGKLSNEVGHRNYQHPARTLADFGGYIDHFSAWTIYVSLVILATDPGMMQKVGGGEEFLIFQRADFESPHTSKVFALLETHPDHRIRQIGGLFRSLAYLSVPQIPSLDGQSFAYDDAPRVMTVATKGDWWASSDGQPGGVTGSGKPVGVRSEPARDISWLFDHVAKPPPKKRRVFSIPMHTRMISILLAVLLVAALVLCPTWPELAKHTGWTFLLCFIGGDALLLWGIYSLRPETKESSKLWRRHRKQVREIVKIEREFAREQERILAAVNPLRTKQEKAEARIASLKAAEQKQKDERNAVLRMRLSEIDKRRLALNQSEARELQRVQDEKGMKLLALKRQMAALTQERTEEFENALRSTQSAFVTHELQQFSIGDAGIAGIGFSLKRRLASEGIRTAADITDAQVQAVSGIGASKAAALILWKESLVRKLRSRIPSTISPAQEAAIKGKYDMKIVVLQGECTTAENEIAGASNIVRQRLAATRTSLQEEETRERERARFDIEQIERSNAPELKAAVADLQGIFRQIGEKDAKRKAEQQERQKKLFTARWQVTEVERELVEFQAITLLGFLRRAVIPR